MSIFFAVAVIPKSRVNLNVKVDYLGGMLLVTSISALIVALNQGQKEGWESFYILSLVYGTVVSFILFLITEFKVCNPMIDMRLFSMLHFRLQM